MNNFCSNCGNKLKPNDTFCSNCGSPVNNIQAQTYSSKPLGNGITIAGMVLGIIGASFLLIAILQFNKSEIIQEVWKVTLKNDVKANGTYGFIFGIGYTLFSWLPGVIGLPLSISGCKKHKDGRNITGIILNSISIVGALIIMIYISTLF